MLLWPSNSLATLSVKYIRDWDGNKTLSEALKEIYIFLWELVPCKDAEEARFYLGIEQNTKLGKADCGFSFLWNGNRTIMQEK